jgi:hypothetical protein
VAGNNTYIRALLTLELGDSIIGRRGVTAQLEFELEVSSIDVLQVGDSASVGERGMQVVDGTCDTEVTKLGAIRADRRHWRAAEKFLAASILN